MTLMADGRANVVDFGADPFGNNSSLNAFVQAQLASPVIYVPPGRFGIDQFNLNSGTRLTGAGSGGVTTLFRYGGISTTAILLTMNNRIGVIVEDMTIDAGECAEAIWATSALNLHLRRMEIKNARGASIVLGGCTDFYVRDLTINNGGIGATGNEHGLSIFDCAKGSIRGCHIDTVRGAGINMGNCTRMRVSDNDVRVGSDNQFGAIRCSNQSKGLVISDNVLTGGIRSLNMNGCKDIAFVNNVCVESSSDAIQLRAGSTTIIETGQIASTTCEGHLIEGNSFINVGVNQGAACVWIYGTDGQANRDHVIVGNIGRDRRSPQLCGGVVRNWSGTAGDNIVVGYNRGNVPESVS